MSGHLMHLGNRLLNTPLLIHPAKAEIILSALSDRIGLDASLFETDAIDMPDASRFVGSARRSDGTTSMMRTADGVAIIPVLDTLVNRGAWLDSRSGLTSYEGIAAQLRATAQDPDIRSVLLDISSPGGEAAGMAGLADMIRSVRQAKPVTAFVNDMAASAAYGIASGASEIVISPTSILGSIGVVMLHADRSGELAAQGVKPTLIFAGSHKVDGNPFEPLSDSVRADLQASVDAHYRQFLETVAQGRDLKLTADMARATEARTFIGTEAVARGLADRIASFDEVLSTLTQQSSQQPRPSGRTARKGGIQMSTDDTQPDAENAGISMAVHEAAVRLARQEERSRITGIVNSDAAQGRMAQAIVFATETTLSLQEATRLLLAAPKENRLDDLAARATSGTEIGSSPASSKPDRGLRSEEGWKRAVHNANRRFEKP